MPHYTALVTLLAVASHGSAHDIAGKGVADPGVAMIEAITRLAKVKMSEKQQA